MKKKAVPLLRIAFVCFSPSKGGLELMLVRIAASLQRRGHSVLFVCRPGSPLHDECYKAGITRFPRSPFSPYFAFPTALTLARLFRRTSTQIIVTGTSKDISTAVLTKVLLRGLKLLYFQQMQSGFDKRDPIHRWTYRHIDHWITLTHAMKESTQQTTIVPSGSISVIPFGADLSAFRPHTFSQVRARRLFGLPRGKKIIAVVGRLDPQKGQEVLLRAAPLVLKRIPTAHFLLVGEETHGEFGYRDRLNDVIRSLKLTSRVTILPFTENVPALLAGLDLIAMPSFSETFGYLAVESMAMGIPVIGTRAGGLPEIVGDGTTGILVPPRNSEELAAAITKTLSNKRLYKTMSQQGMLRARTLFDFEKNLAIFEERLLNLTS
jgi:D-inositol-3-phosphate glycosyltransferase